jgi:hypothetical protein
MIRMTDNTSWTLCVVGYGNAERQFRKCKPWQITGLAPNSI